MTQMAEITKTQDKVAKVLILIQKLFTTDMIIQEER